MFWKQGDTALRWAGPGSQVREQEAPEGGCFGTMGFGPGL